MSRDEALRARQKADEERSDYHYERRCGSERAEWVRWCAYNGVDPNDSSPEDRHRYRVERGWETDDRLALFDQDLIEIDFAERMLRDGADQETLVQLVLAMRHPHDPNFVVTEGDECTARESVEIAALIISGKLDDLEDDEEETDDWHPFDPDPRPRPGPQPEGDDDE